MTHVVNSVRRGLYLDSLALMRISQSLSGLPGVDTVSLMIGTPANRQILDEAGMLAADGRTAGANDLIIAIKAADEAAAAAALAAAGQRLDQPQAMASAGERRPRTIEAASNALGGANLAIISVPGEFAANEARKALARGLHVLLFSDNVPYDQELALKLEAQKRGLLLMGPDCGTALIGGVPLAFANEVRQGDIGIVSASGTGLQEISTLIARAGGGVSHGIGVGGRDLSEKIGALTTLMAIDALDNDPATRHIIVISKPPAASVAGKVLERVARSTKTFTICFLGEGQRRVPTNAKLVPTLAAAAADALGKPVEVAIDIPAMVRLIGKELDPTRRWIRGIYSGGTLCAEAQIVLRDAGEAFWSNAAVPGAASEKPAQGHVLIDYGADEYTVGRPHPMIDPTLRNEALRQALADRDVAVVLIDVVIGHGAHEDPAGAVVAAAASAPTPRPAIIASVTGTDADPQNRTLQVAKLEKAGIAVAASNAQAAALALAIVRRALAAPFMRIAVLGGGNGSYAAAADLAELGHEVRLWRRDAAAFAAVLNNRTLVLHDSRGRREARLAQASSDIGAVVHGVELIVCPTPAFAQDDIAQVLAPHLSDGQVVFLPPGTFGSYTMMQVARRHGCTAAVSFAETGTLPYLARKHGPAEIAITVRAKRLPTGVFPADRSARALAVLRQAYPAVEPIEDALSAALMNAGPIIHPPLILMNAGPLEHSDRFDIHNEGTQPSIRRVTDALDDERIAVREALGYRPYHFPLRDHYTSDRWMYGDAHDKLIDSGDWREKIVLTTHRYMTEDVHYGLAFLVSVADWAQVPVPVAQGLLALGGAICGRQLRQGPRTLEALGLAGLSRAALLERLRRGDA